MNVLDPETMSAVTALVVTVCAALYLVDTVGYAGNAAARLWAVAFACGTLTAFAYLVWTVTPDGWIAVAVGNASFVASIGLLWLGCRRFNGPDLTRAIWVLVLAVGGTFVAAIVPGPDGGAWAGASVMLGSMAALAGLACREARRRPMAEFPAATTLTLVFGAVALYYAMRTMVFVVAGPSSALFVEWFGTASTSIATIVLTIAAATSMVVLRIQYQSASTARSASVLVLSHDGFLDRPSFVRVVAAVLERAQPQRGSTAVIALQLDGLGEVGAAFGGAQARRLVDDLHAVVREAAPAATLLGADGGARVLICHTQATGAAAMRVADRLARQVLGRLHGSDVPAVPVLGIGVAAAVSEPGVGAAGLEEATALVEEAVRAASVSAANSDSAPVLAAGSDERGQAVSR